MPENQIKLEENIHRQCKIYIDSIIAGVKGDVIRFHAHAAFYRELVMESDESALDVILHNLDQIIGFTVESVGKPVSQNARKTWADALFDQVWYLYSCSEYWEKDGGE